MAKEGVMVRGWLCAAVAGGERVDIDDPGGRALLAEALSRNAAATVLPPAKHTEQSGETSIGNVENIEGDEAQNRGRIPPVFQGAR